jgi:hypothetical protein
MIKKKTDNPLEGVSVSNDLLLHLFGLDNPNSITRLAREGVLIKHTRDQYDAYESIRKYIQHLKKTPKNIKAMSGGVGDTPREKMEFRLLEAKTVQEESKAELMTGNLHHRDYLIELFGGLIANAKKEFRTLPNNICRELAVMDDPATIQAFLLRYIDETLTGLSDYEIGIDTDTIENL